MNDISELFTEVADAIRNKKGTTDKIVATDFPTEIGGIDTIKGEKITITPSTIDQTYLPSEDKNAIIEVFVPKVTSAIDANIVPENIKSGVTVLGVNGSFSGEVNNQNITIKENGTYGAGAGYTGLGTVIVNVEADDGIPDEYEKLEYTNLAYTLDYSPDFGGFKLVADVKFYHRETYGYYDNFIRSNNASKSLLLQFPPQDDTVLIFGYNGSQIGGGSFAIPFETRFKMSVCMGRFIL